jgi:signal transduction histidine kinase
VTVTGDSDACALVDASALEQAVGHLVQNGLDASSADAVTVTVSAAGPNVAVAVSDKGVGMDGDFIRNRLFQPFASTKSGGFGIGAFEARSLITAMGGRMSVDSRPGQGTTFTILLPAAAAAGTELRKSA